MQSRLQMLKRDENWKESNPHIQSINPFQTYAYCLYYLNSKLFVQPKYGHNLRRTKLDNLVFSEQCRALHEKDRTRMSRAKFFLIVMICSFSWYLFPGYLFPTLTSISWMCWAFSKSVTAQQLGSGMRGLGLGAITLDWTAIASFLGSPLVTPFFAIMNVFAGYALIIYIVLPTAYWGFNLYGAKKFPIFSSHLFTAEGQKYNISAIVNDKFELDIENYERQGRIHLSMFFSLTYGFGFATIASTLTHVTCFYGR